MAPVFLGLGYFRITFFISIHLPENFTVSVFFTPEPLKSVGTGQGVEHSSGWAGAHGNVGMEAAPWDFY